jgi:hypothetical protein
VARQHVWTDAGAQQQGVSHSETVFWKEQRRAHVINWQDEYQLSQQSF